MRVEVYGHSDDCIEVEGGPLTDEFGAYNATTYLHFGDGTVIEACYSPEDDVHDYGGGWRIRPVKVADGTTVERVPGTYEGDNGDGTPRCDKLIITGDLRSVQCWSSADGPTGNDIKEWFSNHFNPRDLTADQAKQIMAICLE